MSMVFNFFAMPDEVNSLWDWLGKLQGIQFIEESSRPDRPCRQWTSYPADELKTAEGDFGVVAWPSEVGGAPIARHVVFEPETARQLRARGRTVLITPARIRFFTVRAPGEGDIGPTELVYETEALARKSGLFTSEQVEAIDWPAMQRMISAIKKEIRRRATANWRAAPVLPGVARYLENSETKLWLWGATGTV